VNTTLDNAIAAAQTARTAYDQSVADLNAVLQALSEAALAAKISAPVVPVPVFSPQ
jgi:hypothetical protein